jgi:predicted HAD superfamily phosphohydrolase
LALNDNAFELCRDFLGPAGAGFFTQVSRYDDYLADILQKPGYKAGDTLKLILPFLRAVGLTNERLTTYSEKSLKLMPDAQAAYPFLRSLGFPMYEISTSYRQFAEAVGLKLGFAPERIFSTALDLDRYPVPEGEGETLRRLQAEIVAAPEIKLPPGAKSPKDLTKKVEEAIALLDRIFFETIPRLEIGRIYQEVNPLGGAEKRRALEDSLAGTGVSLKDVIYVGDSITDVEIFRKVQAGGGLSLSFNGNRYAVNAAEFSVVADNTWPLPLLAVIFRDWGREGIEEVATSGRAAQSRILALPEIVIDPIMEGLKGRNFTIQPRQTPHREALIDQSLAMRRQLRGRDIGSLG